VFRKGIEHPLQNLLALAKRLMAKIVPVEVQQIEDEVGQRMGRPLIEGRLQFGEAALALSVQHHHLTIEHRALHL
jgi:hypothetical protein